LGGITDLPVGAQPEMAAYVKENSKFYPMGNGKYTLLYGEKKVPLFDKKGQPIQFDINAAQFEVEQIEQRGLQAETIMPIDIDQAYRNGDTGMLHLYKDILEKEGKGKREGLINTINKRIEQLDG